MYMYIKRHTWRPLHPVLRRCCFLLGSWPNERSQNDDLDTSQTHADTTLSENQTHTHTSKKVTQLLTDTEFPMDHSVGWVGTSLGKLLLENTLRGQDRWWCLEIQLRMFSHSAVPLGGGPSSLCSNTSCFWARTAPPSNIRSNCRLFKRKKKQVASTQLIVEVQWRRKVLTYCGVRLKSKWTVFSQICFKPYDTAVVSTQNRCSFRGVTYTKYSLHRFPNLI